jgi:hypothetical protein
MNTCRLILLLMVVLGVVVEVHGRTLHVDNGHAAAADGNPATADRPLKTVSRAAALAGPGDTVEIGAGVYREHVDPARGGTRAWRTITYRARPGDKVVIKGSDLWKPQWERAAIDGVRVVVWQARLDPALFTYDFPIENFNPFHQSPARIYKQTVEDYYMPVRPTAADKPLALTRGALFLDGQPLRQITDPTHFNLVSGAFMVSRDGNSVFVRLAFDRAPQGLTFEIVTREQVFAPRVMGMDFIHLQGLEFEHAANGNGVPQFGMVSATRGGYWLIEDCTFRLAGTAGADIGRAAWYDLPGRGHYQGTPDEPGPEPANFVSPLDGFTMVVRRCRFIDNGSVGLWCYAHGRSILVEDCVFERNNRLARFTWEEAGIKCHGISNSVFRNNLIRETDSYGLWLDVCGTDNRITQNLFIGNMNSGVFIEAPGGSTLVDNNISAYSRPFTFYQMTQADGVYNHQSSNTYFVHNLAFGNAGFGFRNLLHSVPNAGQPDDPKHKIQHNRVLNNIAYANGRGAVSLPVDQPVCGDNISAGNLFWGATDAPLFELQRGVMAPSKYIALIARALSEHNIPANQAPLLDLWQKGKLGPNVGDMRHNGLMVGLPVWQAVQGYDMDAVVGPLPNFRLYRDGRIVLNLKVPTEPRGKGAGETDEFVGARPGSYVRLADVKCERLPYIKYDYFGRQRPADAPPTVGPIQDLTSIAGDGEVIIPLWPNASPDRPPASEMRINIKPLPVIPPEAPEPTDK